MQYVSEEPPEGGGEAVPDPQVEVTPDQQPEQPTPDAEQVAPQQSDPEPEPWLTWTETPTPDEPTPDAKPKTRAKQKKAEPKTAKPKRRKPRGAIRNWGDLERRPTRQFAMPIMPQRAVIMLCGAKSSLKTYTLMCLAGMKAYGLPWHDGEKIKPGICFIVTNEDGDDWPVKRAGWLRENGKPYVRQDNVKLIEHDDESFHRQVVTRHGVFEVNRLDLLDEASVRILLAQCKDTCDAEGLDAGFIAFDTLTSLVPGNIDKPRAQVLTRNLHILSDGLNCPVLLFNHVHRKDKRAYQGVAALADNIDGLFYMVRDEQRRLDEPRPLRAVLDIERLKGCRDGFAYEFIGTVVTLGFDRKGKPIETVVMKLIGLTSLSEVAIDKDAGIRKQVLAKMTPGTRLSSSAVIRMLAWDETSAKKGDGGHQHKVLQRAFPTEWVGAAMDDGSAREGRRVIERGRHWIECRLVIPEKKPSGRPLKPDPEPDTGTVIDGTVVELFSDKDKAKD
jgi:hypothetical protein